MTGRQRRSWSLPAQLKVIFLINNLGQRLYPAILLSEGLLTGFVDSGSIGQRMNDHKGLAAKKKKSLTKMSTVAKGRGRKPWAGTLTKGHADANGPSLATRQFIVKVAGVLMPVANHYPET